MPLLGLSQRRERDGMVQCFDNVLGFTIRKLAVGILLLCIPTGVSIGSPSLGKSALPPPAQEMRKEDHVRLFDDGLPSRAHVSQMSLQGDTNAQRDFVELFPPITSKGQSVPEQKAEKKGQQVDKDGDGHFGFHTLMWLLDIVWLPVLTLLLGIVSGYVLTITGLWKEP